MPISYRKQLSCCFLAIFTFLAILVLATVPGHAYPKRMSDLEKKYLVGGIKHRVIDRKYFFAKVGRSFRGYNRYRTRQTEIYNLIFDFWDKYPELKDLRWLAYILGTGEYESAHRMYPVRETLASTDDRAIRIMDTHSAYRKVRHWAKHKHKGYYYWRRLKNHGNRTYVGRGLIQITHHYNYRAWGKYMGMGDGLYLNPQRAYENDIAMQALVKGMILGVFRRDRRGRHSLARHFPPQSAGLPASQQRRLYKKARSIVNGGLYHADQILVGALKFKKILKYRKNLDPRYTKPDVPVRKAVLPLAKSPGRAEQFEENRQLVAERDAEITRLTLALKASRRETSAQKVILGRKIEKLETVIRGYNSMGEKTMDLEIVREELEGSKKQLQNSRSVLEAERRLYRATLLSKDKGLVATQVALQDANSRISVLESREMQQVERDREFAAMKVALQAARKSAQQRVAQLEKDNAGMVRRVANAGKVDMAAVREAVSREFFGINSDVANARKQLVLLRQKIGKISHDVAERLALHEEHKNRSLFNWKEKYRKLKAGLGRDRP